MPTYEYVCEACGHSWDAFQSIKDDPLTTCPSCSAAKARRVISGGMGFILKGGGWYSDLYASPKADAGKSGSDSTSNSSSSSEGTSSAGESKAAKTPAKTPTKTDKPSSSD
jgi:putative FmdB family regulatory protein